MPAMALIPETVARKHAERLRNLASLFVLAELDGYEAMTPVDLVKTLEAIAVEFESALEMPAEEHA